MTRSRRGGRLLQLTGWATLAFAAFVLVPLGTDALLVAAVLGFAVLPSLAAASAAVLTGRALQRDPGRSRVPAAVAALSLAASAGFFAVWWTELEPGPFPLSSAAALRAESVVLAVLATAALCALALVLAPGPRRPVPRWATGAAWVTVGLVALLTGQLVVLSFPRFEPGFSAEQERVDDQTCREGRALPARTTADVDVGGLELPSFEGAEPLGAAVLPAAATGSQVGTGLDRYARTSGPVVIALHGTRTEDADDLARLLDDGLRRSGLTSSGRSSVTVNGDEELQSVSYTAPAREGRVDVLSCAPGRVLVVAEAVPVARSGVCASPERRARCDRLLAATADVTRRFGAAVPTLDGSRLVLRTRTSDFAPVTFLVDDLDEAFAGAGWRRTSSSCGDDCFAVRGPVRLTYARPGLAATVVLDDRGGGDTEVEVVVRETGS